MAGLCFAVVLALGVSQCNDVAQAQGVPKPEISAPGVTLCEHLPHLAKQAHHLAIVRSLGDHGRGTGDHHAGYYYNLTGHAPDRNHRHGSVPIRRVNWRLQTYRDVSPFSDGP